MLRDNGNYTMYNSRVNAQAGIIDRIVGFSTSNY